VTAVLVDAHPPARFKSPLAPARSDFGQADTTAYEAIEVPTLVLAGANDKLREPGYAEAIAARIPRGRVRVYENCGHVPNLEVPRDVAADILAFLADVDRSSNAIRPGAVAGSLGR
jgi:pimeloyl-ACP methyl ester carboxylesterase